MKQAEFLHLPFLFNETEACISLKVRVDALRAWVSRDELVPVAQNAAGQPLFRRSDLMTIGARLAARENVRVLRANPVNVTEVPSRNRPHRRFPKLTT
jgi:hypothetical protein